jgi:hypothetical protein
MNEPVADAPRWADAPAVDEARGVYKGQEADAEAIPKRRRALLPVAWGKAERGPRYIFRPKVLMEKGYGEIR